MKSKSVIKTNELGKNLSYLFEQNCFSEVKISQTHFNFIYENMFYSSLKAFSKCIEKKKTEFNF